MQVYVSDIVGRLPPPFAKQKESRPVLLHKQLCKNFACRLDSCCWASIIIVDNHSRNNNEPLFCMCWFGGWSGRLFQHRRCHLTIPFFLQHSNFNQGYERLCGKLHKRKPNLKIFTISNCCWTRYLPPKCNRVTKFHSKFHTGHNHLHSWWLRHKNIVQSFFI